MDANFVDEGQAIRLPCPTPRRFDPASRCLWSTIIMLLALAAIAQAQDSAQPAPPADPLARVAVRVLDQQQVEIGSHKVTFKRIAPPSFPAAAALTPAPAAMAPTRSIGMRSPTRSAPAFAAVEQKQLKLVFFSTTVYEPEFTLSLTAYEHRFTEVRCSSGAGGQLRAYANIDFTLFGGMSQIETADTLYLLFYGLELDTVDKLIQAGRQPPDLASFLQGHSSYQIVEGSVADHPNEIAALDAMCAYYDANKAQLIADYQQRQDDNAAREQETHEQPPAQPDTVINYWPVKNSIYLNQSR